MAAQVRVPGHGRAGVAGERGELVNVAGVFPPRDPPHHLAADPVILAGVVRQHVHALLPGKLPDHRHRFGAAHFDGVQNLVGYAGWRRLREKAA